MKTLCFIRRSQASFPFLFYEIRLWRVKSLRGEIPLRGVTDGFHFTVR